MLFVSKVDKIDCSTLSHLIFSLNNISLLSYRVVRACIYETSHAVWSLIYFEEVHSFKLVRQVSEPRLQCYGVITKVFINFLNGVQRGCNFLPTWKMAFPQQCWYPYIQSGHKLHLSLFLCMIPEYMYTSVYKCTQKNRRGKMHPMPRLHTTSIYLSCLPSFVRKWFLFLPFLLSLSIIWCCLFTRQGFSVSG